jgi:hypothetical protein
MSVVTVILLVLGIYIALNVLAYFVQEQILFRPEKLPQQFEYKYDFPFEELFFDIKPGVRINGLYFFAHDPQTGQRLAQSPQAGWHGLVIYFHGNSRSIKGWGKHSVDFTRRGFDVVMIDYRGFGKSTGRRTEEDLKTDAQFVYEQLVVKLPESRIVVYGRSMGSGFAAKLASANFPRMLILDAPYYSLSRVTRRYLPFVPVQWVLRYPVRTHTWLKYVKCPIRILHGTHDWLIPLKQSEDLAQIMPQLVKLYAIKEGKHNNLPLFKQYHDALADILEEAKNLTDDRAHERVDLF